MTTIEKNIIGVLLKFPENYNLISNYFDLFQNNDSIEIIRIIKIIRSKVEKYDLVITGSYIIDNKIQSISLSYLNEIFDSCYTDANIKYYLEELCKTSLKEKLNKYCNTDMSEDQSTEEIKQNIFKIFEDVKSVDEMEIEDGKKEYVEMVNDIEGGIIQPKIYSGYQHIEDNNDGYNLTDYIILGGGEGVGKTSFMLQLVSKQLMKGLRIAIFEGEMERKTIYYLLACMVAGLNPKCVQKGLINKTQKEQLCRALEKLYEKPLYVYNERNWNKIKDKSYIMKNKFKVDMFYHDYLQYLRLPGVRDQYQRLEIISAETKDLAVQLNTPICQLSSLNRTGKTDEPESYHIKGNGDIEYNADIIMLIWNQQNNISGDYNKKGVRLKVSKNRYGALNKENYIFNMALKRFEKEY